MSPICPNGLDALLMYFVIMALTLLPLLNTISTSNKPF